jgi:prevent-host-death family protein
MPWALGKGMSSDLAASQALLARPELCSNVTTCQPARRKESPVAITTMSSREFNQDTSGAKKAARTGPVFITDRGRPAHVLLTIEDYQRITGGRASIVDMLAMPGVEDIDFEPPRLGGKLHRAADLSK